jgi:hypothetical protein
LHVHCCPLILFWAVVAAALDSDVAALALVYLLLPWSAPQVRFFWCQSLKSSMSGHDRQQWGTA